MPGVKDWIKKASGNLKSAKNLQHDDETLDFAAYATQQSAEKALKAYLVFKGQAIPRTHDLTKLLIECSTFDSTFDHLRKSAATLSPYAMYTRYPDDRFAIDHNEIVEAITHAKKILNFVKTKVEPPAKIQQLDLFENRS
jgi:Uncharacterized conserved protein related to C-terminal domain of eukaryotic chaperone, SACSIN